MKKPIRNLRNVQLEQSSSKKDSSFKTPLELKYTINSTEPYQSNISKYKTTICNPLNTQYNLSHISLQKKRMKITPFVSHQASKSIATPTLLYLHINRSLHVKNPISIISHQPKNTVSLSNLVFELPQEPQTIFKGGISFIKHEYIDCRKKDTKQCLTEEKKVTTKLKVNKGLRGIFSTNKRFNLELNQKYEENKQGIERRNDDMTMILERFSNEFESIKGVISNTEI